MKVRLKAKFFFDNGEVRRVVWTMTDPAVFYGNPSNPVKTVLKSTKEVLDEFQKSFRKLHKEGEIFTVTNVHDELSGVHFNKVSYWTLKVDEIKEGEHEVTATQTQESTFSI